MKDLLEKLHEKTDGLAIDVYHLLEELKLARRGYAIDGSHPLDHMFNLLSKIAVRVTFMEISAREIDTGLNENTLEGRRDG